MDNWYYVVGSERVGPVSSNALRTLLLSGEVTHESYVWKKGFQTWEKLKDVLHDIESSSAEMDAPQAPKEVESPEVKFTFSWNSLNENEDRFFAKIGKDRRGVEGEIYGPYTLIELKEALNGKRINLQTLIFSPGMSSWTKIQDTPINELFKGVSLSTMSLHEVPLLLVFDNSPAPLVSVVKKAGTKESILLGTKSFGGFKNKTLRASLYVGSEMKVKNIQVMIENYDLNDQSMECKFVDLNQDAKKIILNHAV